MSSTEDIDEELIIACRDGNLEEVKRLLAAGANVNADVDGSRPLIAAARNGLTEVVRFLLDIGANIDETDQYGYKTCSLLN